MLLFDKTESERHAIEQAKQLMASEFFQFFFKQTPITPLL